MARFREGTEVTRVEGARVAGAQYSGVAETK